MEVTIYRRHSADCKHKKDCRQSLAEQLEALGSPAFPGTYTKWREEVNKVIQHSRVKMTPHGFRHYRITELLAAGVRVEDVAGQLPWPEAKTK